ncbi:MAG: PmoA family protein [Cytophagales bacterium]|nr:PmoA family protein [Cytophagales bacterium]
MKKHMAPGAILLIFVIWMVLGCGMPDNPSERPSKSDRNKITAEFDANGQVIISDDDKPVLRYNYQIVYEHDEYAFNGLDANEYIVTPDDTFMANPSIYAVPRCDYIHPVFGLNGEILTRDWSKDHPHHRGIYWAWPEVDFGTKRTDLHALQKVFARPTGRIKLDHGPDYAQIEAENIWIVEEGVNTIVREIALIRAYSRTDYGRVIDLAYWFEGLKDSVTLARRGTQAYGGLNIRMMTPKSQEISFHTDEPAGVPQRAWSDLSGVFAGNDEPSGLTVFQHKENPEYPGAWVQYPELSWVQPTFPDSGTRYPLKPGKPLVLRFRLIVHPGSKPDVQLINKLWDAYHTEEAPGMEFTL